MFRSLFSKLTLTLLLMFSFLGLLAMLLTLYTSGYYQQEVMQKLNHDVAEHIVSETPLLKNGKLNHPALNKLFHSIMVINPSLEIYLIDAEGDILAFSAPPWKVVRQAVDLAPIKNFLSGPQLFPVVGDDPRNFTRKKIFSAAAVDYGDQFKGYLYVILGGEEFDDIVSRLAGSYILKDSLAIFATGLFFSAFAGIFVMAGLTRRLNRLSRAISGYRKNSEFDPGKLPVCKKNGDEIDQLTLAFREMAGKIFRQLDALQSTDILRREMVANVSHDLRTPLATLQGYIETMMLKAQDLNIQQRQQYLAITLKHCHQLNKRVAELFELARLDAHETQADPEVFNIAELLHDIAQKFTLQANKKNIAIQIPEEQMGIFVIADISLIERVIENLLENALRHTPESGNIQVGLQFKKDSVQIRVSDNGCGIPQAEVPYIFDRFYQLDKTRNPDDHSSGLGLAIVKRIIELHQSVIQVTSVPYQKTTFSFSLPVAPQRELCP